MNPRRALITLLSFTLLGHSVTLAMAASEQESLALVDAGSPACRLVIIADGKSEVLLKRSADQISDTINRWTEVKLPLVTLHESNRELPADQAIVLTTLSALTKVAPDLISSHKEFAQAATIDEQGFVCVPITNKNAKQLFIVSQTPRGVYNGAVYLRDFCIDGTKQNLNADFRPLVRSPHFGGRPAYALAIWGNASEYTADDWDKMFDRFARDGMDRIYFWVSGHFPSKLYPQTYKRDYKFGDTPKIHTTKDSRIGTIEDLKNIIDSAHQKGMKIYLGGAFGGWVGSMYLTNMEPETLKVGPKEPSLCPSNKKAHAAMVNSFVEIFNALPEADGLFIESTDEFGECKCAECSRKLDELGSKQFGQSQLDLCEEIMKEIWRDHPHARLCYTIGYAEHKSDALYYQRIKKMSQDSRYEWMEARQSWTFPGSTGEPLPTADFSDRVMHWKQYYYKSIPELVTDAQRAQKERCYGLIVSFEPGYATGSFYTDIPFPTDILPYALTGFAYREVTWGTGITTDRMLELTQARFFGKDAPPGLSKDLWALRDIVRTKKGVEQLAAIEQHIQEAQSNAGPKTLEGLTIMTRAVDDIHKYLPKKTRK